MRNSTLITLTALALLGFSCGNKAENMAGTNSSSSLVSNTSSGARNPAHGQPGHRCDIAVGAPLNSPTGQSSLSSVPKLSPVPQTVSTAIQNDQITANQVASNTQQSVINAAPVADAANPGKTQTVTVNPPAPTKPGMNPPHGQPGHRCDIAVGAPLNSAPAKTVAMPQTTVKTTNVAVAPTKPGMNPPHGQPGHRCDIAVGAPLNSAPAKPATTTTTIPVQSKTDTSQKN